MKRCLQCGSDNICRSHTRNLKEHILKQLSMRPYRCLDCGWRGIGRKSSSGVERRAKYSKENLLLVAIFVTMAIIMMFWWMSLEPDKPEIPSPVGQTYDIKASA